MFKPMEGARKAKKFTSFEELAKRLVASHPALEWPAIRALAVKIGDIDRGDKVWWKRRQAQSAALAELLDIALVDLGLLDTAAGQLFEFATFPELPPMAFEREAPCEIGFVEAEDSRQREDPLAYWLAPSPPRYAWRGPEHRISWLRFEPGSGLSFYWAALAARSRYEQLSARRLVDARERLSRPGKLILHLEEPCDDIDILALARMDPGLSVLIIAAFGLPKVDDDASMSFSLPTWKALTGKAHPGIRVLANPFDPVASYAWRLHDDWQARLLEWVEHRISRASNDTLFTARGTASWLAGFPVGWKFVNGPADLLAVCRLCHLSPETALPRVADLDAGQRLLKRVTGADSTLSRRFTDLVAARMQACELPWRGALSASQWDTLEPFKASIADQSALLEIANAKNAAARRERALALSAQMRATALAPLTEARLLIATQADTLVLAPQFLVDLIARDRLMLVIRDQPLSHWARFCHDPDRRLLVDAALGSMPVTELLVVLERLKSIPAASLTAIAAGEALFREIGKRACTTANIPMAFGCLADIVLPRLLECGFVPQPWTRPDGDPDELLEWAAICWAWSLWRPAPPVEIPDHWAWHFPGWTPQLAHVEMSHLWLIGQPQGPALTPEWQRMLELAARLAQAIDEPPRSPPEFLEPLLLVEALRGRWPIDAQWIETVLGRGNTARSEAIEDLLLDAMASIGREAAALLLPALMNFILTGPGDGIRARQVHYSHLRTWTLENISFPEAVACLSERQLGAALFAPQTLPPHFLDGMLLEPDAGLPSLASARMAAVHVLDADHIETLKRLLATESLGSPAAVRLWEVAPEMAEHLLLVTTGDDIQYAVDRLVLSTPLERTGAAARAILAGACTLPPDQLAYWAQSRLPTAGAHAAALARILKLDDDDAE